MKIVVTLVILLCTTALYGMEEVDLIDRLLKEFSQKGKQKIETTWQRRELTKVLNESRIRRKCFWNYLNENPYAYGIYLKNGYYGFLDLSLSLEKECNKSKSVSIEVFVEGLSGEQVKLYYEKYQKEM